MPAMRLCDPIRPTGRAAYQRMGVESGLGMAAVYRVDARLWPRSRGSRCESDTFNPSANRRMVWGMIPGQFFREQGGKQALARLLEATLSTGTTV